MGHRVLSALGCIGVVLCFMVAPAQAQSLKMFHDQIKVDSLVDDFLTGKKADWFGESTTPGAAEQLSDAMAVREDRSPYITQDGNILVAGDAMHDGGHHAAVVLSPTGWVLAIGALRKNSEDETYKLTVVSRKKGEYAKALQDWATLKVGHFAVETLALASVQNFPSAKHAR